ncbi:MAG: hypothetical protein SWO11_07960 [Thermodesulfobacteriota bacterium]|nr:hypothetical protein [Thermodesulfobacteriota bacterium]
MEFIHLYNLQRRIGAKLIQHLTERFDPIVNGDVAASQKRTDRTKLQSFEEKSSACRFTSVLFPRC